VDGVGYGSIVTVADMLDPQGRNPKDRPALVVSRDEDISPGEPLIVVAISTLRPGAAQPQWTVKLPWDRRGHPRTGLTTNCVAVCDWIEEIDEGRIKPGPRRFLTGRPLLAVGEMLAELDRRQSEN
jgi:mRNA-degrading endonuclease toxin of MazEF toxin-antitoxin module